MSTTDNIAELVENQGKPNKPRLDFVDFARAICALWVVTAHLLSMRFGLIYDPDNPFPYYLDSYVHEAVTAFICISGFSLFISIAKNKAEMNERVGQYFVSRALRILPPYYFALIVGAIATQYFQAVPRNLFHHELWDHILLIQDYTGRVNLIVPPMWSIAVEWHIYFILPLLVLCFRRFGIVNTLICSVIAGFCLSNWIGIPSMYFRYYSLFCVGGACALIAYADVPWATRFRSLPWRIISLTLFALFFLGVGLTDLDFQFGLAVCTGLLAAGLNKNEVVYPKFLVWIGGWSYSLYLVHWTILLAELTYFGKTTKFLLIGFAASLICSYIFYLLFENPFMHLRKYILRRKRAIATNVLQG